VGDPKVALVVVSSPFEAGGERADSTLAQARATLGKVGLDLLVASGIVKDVADAARVTRGWVDQKIDLLVIVHCSWVEDSLQFQLQRETGAPLMLWSRPEPETYALASVKHFASIAKRTGLSYRWGQGEVDTAEFAERVKAFAIPAAAARRFRHSRVALFTPRTAWRMAGPMDMSLDEWDLGSSLGVTLLHLDLEELVSEAEKETETDAHHELDRHAPAYGNIQAAAERMLFSSKIYLAAKRMIDSYGLDAMAAACYPTHFGLVNLATSWLAEEGFHFDPEGDVGSSVLANAMLALRPKPIVLGEAVQLLPGSDSVLVRHEGSGPASLAAGASEVHVVDLGEQRGTLVEYPLRKAAEVTAATITGDGGEYSLFVARLESKGIPLAEWEERGRGFLGHVTAKGGGAQLLERMFDTGMDHHLLLQEGDQLTAIADLAELWGMDLVRITD
jgi:L-arabinose isomerase